MIHRINCLKVSKAFNNVLYFLFAHKSCYYTKIKKILPYGELKKKQVIKVAQRKYIHEEYTCNSSIDSYRLYKKVVTDFANNKDLLTTKYDLYDWSYTYFLFDKYSLKVNRFGNKLQCIKSIKPISLDSFENDVSKIIQMISTKNETN